MGKTVMLRLVRRKISHDFRYDKAKNDYANNSKNNTLDSLFVIVNQVTIFQCRCQSVANHPEMKYRDTIAAGEFQMECFVDPRQFHGRIHGIVNARDLDGEFIDRYSMQIENGYQKGRWLIHDRFSFAKGRDLNSGYSGGCFILSSADLETLNRTLISLGLKRGDLIQGILEEIE